MVKLSVLYGPPDDPATFEDYYGSTHGRSRPRSRTLTVTDPEGSTIQLGG